MSNLLEKALMELSDGSREKMTDLTSITKRMTDLASIITKRMTPCPNCRVYFLLMLHSMFVLWRLLPLSRVGNI